MYFLQLDSDHLGQGDDPPGRKLLASFLAERARSAVRADVAGCANSGISFTTEGGPALEGLRALPLA